MLLQCSVPKHLVAMCVCVYFFFSFGSNFVFTEGSISGGCERRKLLPRENDGHGQTPVRMITTLTTITTIKLRYI